MADTRLNHKHQSNANKHFFALEYSSHTKLTQSIRPLVKSMRGDHATLGR